MDGKTLEQTYQERLEERIIAYLSEKHGITLEKAMDIYYRSKMAETVHQGKNGAQYLDYKVLAQILHETEPGLFPENTRDGSLR